MTDQTQNPYASPEPVEERVPEAAPLEWMEQIRRMRRLARGLLWQFMLPWFVLVMLAVFAWRAANWLDMAGCVMMVFLGAAAGWLLGIRQCTDCPENVVPGAKNTHTTCVIFTGMGIFMAFAVSVAAGYSVEAIFVGLACEGMCLLAAVTAWVNFLRRLAVSMENRAAVRETVGVLVIVWVGIAVGMASLWMEWGEVVCGVAAMVFLGGGVFYVDALRRLRRDVLDSITAGRFGTRSEPDE